MVVSSAAAAAAATTSAAAATATTVPPPTAAAIRKLYREMLRLVLRNNSAAAAAQRNNYNSNTTTMTQQQQQQHPSVLELKREFRRPLKNNSNHNNSVAVNETLASRYQQGQSRASVLRMLSKRGRGIGGLGYGGFGGKWVYKDGERFAMMMSEKNSNNNNENNQTATATIRNTGGRVVSSYDGKNLDPESVKRHRQQLKRAGFINNAHAKGIF